MNFYSKPWFNSSVQFMRDEVRRPTRPALQKVLLALDTTSLDPLYKANVMWCRFLHSRSLPDGRHSDANGPLLIMIMKR